MHFCGCRPRCKSSFEPFERVIECGLLSGRKLGPASQTGHLRACKRFAAWFGRSPETATPDDVKYFQQHLGESGVSICTRNQTMTGVQFLFRVTLRRHDLVAEIFHLKEPVKVPLVLRDLCLIPI